MNTRTAIRSLALVALSIIPPVILVSASIRHSTQFIPTDNFTSQICVPFDPTPVDPVLVGASFRPFTQMEMTYARDCKD